MEAESLAGTLQAQGPRQESPLQAQFIQQRLADALRGSSQPLPPPPQRSAPLQHGLSESADPENYAQLKAMEAKLFALQQQALAMRAQKEALEQRQQELTRLLQQQQKTVPPSQPIPRQPQQQPSPPGQLSVEDQRLLLLQKLQQLRMLESKLEEVKAAEAAQSRLPFGDRSETESLRSESTQRSTADQNEGLWEAVGELERAKKEKEELMQLVRAKEQQLARLKNMSQNVVRASFSCVTCREG